MVRGKISKVYIDNMSNTFQDNVQNVPDLIFVQFAAETLFAMGYHVLTL